MNITKLNSLLAAYALAHPHRCLASVSELEFAVWVAGQQ
jgi:hypothetical protein